MDAIHRSQGRGAGRFGIGLLLTPFMALGFLVAGPAAVAGAQAECSPPVYGAVCPKPIPPLPLRPAAPGAGKVVGAVSGRPALAATGSSSYVELWIGGITLVTGVALVYLARRRQRITT